jgi:Glycosyltransferase family 87
MNMLNVFFNFFKKPFFTNKKYIIGIWFFLAIVSSLKQFASGHYQKYNNYLIYKGVFFHTINKLSLYDLYPAEFFDRNHYGPIFGLLIAPFALMPDWLGMTLWSVFNTAILVYAINQLPLKYNQINIILWLCAHEFLTTILSFQFNPIMTAIIILSYVLIIKKQDFWAAMVITFGLFVKLYGIVGLAFFFFSKDKIKFIGSLVFWSIVFFILPMLISSPEYICNTYLQWLERLVAKNSENASLASMQDISFMGMFRRIFNSPQWSNLPFLGFGLLLFGLQYLKLNFYSNQKFQLLLLSSVLIFTVIFSSGSESPTYIIAFLGVAIWFVIQEKPISRTTIFLLIFAIILTSLSPSDLIPKYVRENYIRPYALKALPCVLIWFRIVYEIIFLKKEEKNTVISI